MNEEIVTCSICGWEIPWGGTDMRLGYMWNCDECGAYFCEKCAELALGVAGTREMLLHEDDILCPTCHNKRFPKVKVG